MLATSTSPPHSGAGGLTLLFAFVVAPLIVILAIALEALSPSIAGAAVLVALMLLMMAGLIALILRMLTDEVEEPRATAPLPRRAQRGASNSPAPVRRPAAVLMDRRTAV